MSEEFIEFLFCHPPNPTTSVKFSSDTTGADLKAQLPRLLPNSGSQGDEWRLVCGGRVIQDTQSLSSQGITNGSKIYISVKRLAPQSSSQSPQLASQPERGGPPDALMAPLLKYLASNPELYQQMLMSNPQIQQLLEKNPELRHALSDPSTLQSMLSAASNPTAYNEMLRGHDRVLSNLENVPGGFNHLQRVYSTLQEPMYEAMTPKTPINRQRDLNYKSSESASHSKVTSDPVPNPWAPKKPAIISNPLLDRPPLNSPSMMANFKSQAHKRRLNADSDDSLNFEKMFLNPGAASESFKTDQQPILNFNPFASSMMPTTTLPTNTNTAAASSSQSLADRFSNELAALHELGFDDDESENIPALLATGGHVPAAIDRILSKRP